MDHESPEVSIARGEIKHSSWEGFRSIKERKKMITKQRETEIWHVINHYRDLKKFTKDSVTTNDSEYYADQLVDLLIQIMEGYWRRKEEE